MSIFYTRHDGGLTIFKDGKQSAVSSSHQNFNKIIEALKNRELDKLEALMSIEKTINATGVSSNGKSKVFVRNGKVYFMDTRNRKEVELNGALTDRILRDIGKPGCEKYANALMNLMENIQKNLVKDITSELYEWLASGKAPITTDGCILAYKKVRSDFIDIYSGTMDNSPGKVVRMKQADVDTDRRNECSHGLHFASLGYLSRYSNTYNSRVVIVKVNPRHIFAIPKDYNCQKGRASEYYVVGEYRSGERETKEAFNDAFVDEDNLSSSAPDVAFVKTGLRPSLEAVAESYGLVKDGKVRVRSNDKGEKIFVSWVGDQDKNATVDFPKYQTMSFETKSVRNAIKAIIAKLEK
jgi:hypothetical protein